MKKKLEITLATGAAESWDESEFTSFTVSGSNVLLILKDDKIVKAYNPMVWLTLQAVDA